MSSIFPYEPLKHDVSNMILQKKKIYIYIYIVFCLFVCLFISHKHSCAIILMILIAGVKLESWKSIRNYTEEIKSLSCSPIQQLTQAAHGLLSRPDFEEGHYEINKSCTSSNGYVRGILLSCSFKLI